MGTRGTEVLGAIWGAIARVREVIASRTDGAVRFANRGPEGSFALAPLLSSDVARGDRTAARVRGPAADVRLTGRKVVVADDDPGVTWFIADLLRTAGCQVFEALDGTRGLELCYEHAPELEERERRRVVRQHPTPTPKKNKTPTLSSL